MNNPVIVALANARQTEIDRAEAMIRSKADRLLGPFETQAPAMPLAFAQWCEEKGVGPLPAMPASVAVFVLDREAFGADAIMTMLNVISAAHLSAGLADPTKTPVVSAAMRRFVDIEKPRSWPKEHILTFQSLPYVLQRYIADREKEREKVIRQRQNEASDAKKQLEKITAERANSDKPHAA